MKELADLCSGPITDDELEDCRRGLLSGMQGVEDTLGGIETWYYIEVLRGGDPAKVQTPAEGPRRPAGRDQGRRARHPAQADPLGQLSAHKGGGRLMPQNNQTLLEKTVADQWKTLPSGLTVIVRPMPGYSSTHVIFATRFGSIDRDFRLDGKEVHLPAGVAHFLEHKMFEDQDGDAFAKYAKTGANANAFTSFDRTCYLFTATQQLDERAWMCCWAW